MRPIYVSGHHISITGKFLQGLTFLLHLKKVLNISVLTGYMRSVTFRGVSLRFSPSSSGDDILLVTRKDNSHAHADLKMRLPQSTRGISSRATIPSPLMCSVHLEELFSAQVLTLEVYGFTLTTVHARLRGKLVGKLVGDGGTI